MIYEALKLWLYAAEETRYERLELPRRRLVCWAISYVNRGRVIIATSEGQHVAKAGEVMVHPPNQYFSEHSRVPGVHQWLLLDAKDGSGTELLRRHPLPRVLRLAAPSVFEDRFRALKQSWEATDSPLREVQTTSYTLELLSYLLEVAQGATPQPLPASADRFERVVQFMRQNTHRPLSRGDLAGMTHLHPNHFDRAFREIYGLTPTQMLRELRLRQARQLLETTDDTLAVVAEASGFYDVAYFSRTFKARYQQTPGHYRARVKRTKRSYLSLLEGDISVLYNDS